MSDCERRWDQAGDPSSNPRHGTLGVADMPAAAKILSRNYGRAIQAEALPVEFLPA